LSQNKKLQNNIRNRYIKALERFLQSNVTYLSKTQNLTKEGFNKKIDNSLKLLNRVQEVTLYKGYYQDLKSLVNKLIQYRQDDTDIQEIKEKILYSANQLEKTKNFKKYKKPKHQNYDYDY
jgi:hypothetical protein